MLKSDLFFNCKDNTKNEMLKTDLFFNCLFDFKFLSSLEFRQNVVQDFKLFFCEYVVQQLPHSDHNNQLKKKI